MGEVVVSSTAIGRAELQATRPRLSYRVVEVLTPYLFLLPFFVLFGIFWVGPIVASFGYSFTAWRGITPPVYVGLATIRPFGPIRASIRPSIIRCCSQRCM